MRLCIYIYIYCKPNASGIEKAYEKADLQLEPRKAAVRFIISESLPSDRLSFWDSTTHSSTSPRPLWSVNRWTLNNGNKWILQISPWWWILWHLFCLLPSNCNLSTLVIIFVVPFFVWFQVVVRWRRDQTLDSAWKSTLSQKRWQVFIALHGWNPAPFDTVGNDATFIPLFTSVYTHPFGGDGWIKPPSTVLKLQDFYFTMQSW